MIIAFLHEIHALHTPPDKLGLIALSGPAYDCCARRIPSPHRVVSIVVVIVAPSHPSASSSSSSSSSSYVRRSLEWGTEQSNEALARPRPHPPSLHSSIPPVRPPCEMRGERGADGGSLSQSVSRARCHAACDICARSSAPAQGTLRPFKPRVA